MGQSSICKNVDKSRAGLSISEISYSHHKAKLKDK